MFAMTAAAAPALATELRADVFARYIEWIDRSPATTRAYTINLRAFAAYLRYTGTTRPTRATVIAYRDWLCTTHPAIQYDADALTGWTYRTDKAGNAIEITCKPTTVKQYLRSVSGFFKWTAAEGIYPDIAAGIHAPKVTATHRKDALTVEDVQTVERSITERAAAKVTAATSAKKDSEGRTQRADEQGKRIAAMYALAVNAGLRCVEISRANVKDIEVKGGQAVLFVWGKGHAEPDQRKPLAPEVYAAIREYLDARTDSPTGNSPLFVSTGNRSGGKRIAPTTISTMLKRALREAGFNSERITAHSLRHTAGTACMQVTGGNLYTTQKYMRHANPATTEIYLHTEDAKHEANVAEQLYDLYHGKQQSARDRLGAIMSTLTPDQLERLATIAAAMV